MLECHHLGKSIDIAVEEVKTRGEEIQLSPRTDRNSVKNLHDGTLLSLVQLRRVQNSQEAHQQLRQHFWHVPLLVRARFVSSTDSQEMVP